MMKKSLVVVHNIQTRMILEGYSLPVVMVFVYGREDTSGRFHCSSGVQAENLKT